MLLLHDMRLPSPRRAVDVLPAQDASNINYLARMCFNSRRTRRKQRPVWSTKVRTKYEYEYEYLSTSKRPTMHQPHS